MTGQSPDAPEPDSERPGEDRSGRKKTPERRCIVSGDTGTTATLVRFAIGPDDQVVPDIEGRLPGRGIWVTSDRASVEKAAAKGLFSRAAKQGVKAPADLADQVEAGLKRRVLALLGLARKAGQLMAGHAKVEEAAVKAHVVALFLARDAGAEGLKNAGALSSRTDAPIVADFSAEQLGLALGRPNVVHAALTAGGAASKGRARHMSATEDDRGELARNVLPGDKLSGLIMCEVGRLQGFQGGA
ncbi:MAG: RNA-binding protein [Candidatus Phaeomarinobacter sp.]